MAMRSSRTSQKQPLMVSGDEGTPPVVEGGASRDIDPPQEEQQQQQQSVAGNSSKAADVPVYHLSQLPAVGGKKPGVPPSKEQVECPCCKKVLLRESVPGHFAGLHSKQGKLLTEAQLSKDNTAKSTRNITGFFFFETRFIDCKGAPRQADSKEKGGGWQFVDTAGKEARALIDTCGKVFDLRQMVKETPCPLANRSESLEEIVKIATAAGVKELPDFERLSDVLETLRSSAASPTQPSASRTAARTWRCRPRRVQARRTGAGGSSPTALSSLAR